MTSNNLTSILNEYNVKDIFFGSQGFHIYNISDLDSAQLGYSKHPDGDDLTSTKKGDWKKEWVVFGNDTELGDPYFVDISDKKLPVYTAMHGVGTWEPEDVCNSLKNFLKSLQYLQSASPESYALIEPDEKTVIDNKTLKEIKSNLINISGDKEFWNNFFTIHLEWLDENGS